METPFVIIGGDAAGMSAASKIKRSAPDAHVIVFERAEHISYSACGMPYWIGGIVESDRQLMVLTPEIARKKRGIDVRIRHEAIAIDPATRTVHVNNHETGETFAQAYDKLLIATGARPIYPPIPGVDLPGVFVLRLLADAQRIHAYIEKHSPKRAVIIGGGYVGLEMVEALNARGLETHVIEMQAHVMPNLDADMVVSITEHVQAQGAQLHLNTQANSITAHDSALAVATDAAGTILADLVILSVGVRPNSELAEAAGLRLDAANAIHIDRHFRTSAPDVFAAGDCAVHHHLVLDRPAWIPLAPSANKGGRIAGENMLGASLAFPGILGTAIVKIFDYTVASTGLTEGEARASGLFGAVGEFVGSATIEAKDRSGYWPGVEMVNIKLVFDKRGGRILGCQMVGKDGVNKRIDIVATAITARMTLQDVELLDLSYAPPYSTTHDPIQICASVAQRDLLPEHVG